MTREGNHGLAGHHKTGLLQIKFLINAVNKELLGAGGGGASAARAKLPQNDDMEI